MPDAAPRRLREHDGRAEVVDADVRRQVRDEVRAETDHRRLVAEHVDAVERARDDRVVADIASDVVDARLAGVA